MNDLAHSQAAPELQAPEQAPAPQPAPAPAPAAEPVAADARARPIPRINIQAFCEDQKTAAVLQQVSEDRRLSKAHVTVQMGGIEAGTAFYRNAPTPNLIMVESLHDRDGMLADLERLAAVCDSGTKVLVVGHVNDVLLYRQLMQRGVSEYLVMPLTASDVMMSLSAIYSDPDAEPVGQVVAFVGAKGGVGSSTVCHNTAWAISETIETDVVIADLDLAFGTAGLDFNQDPVQGIADALISPDRLDEVLLDRLLSRCSDHLSLFAAPGTLEQTYDLDPGACDTVIDVVRSNVPYMAVDVPHVWTNWARQVLMHADHIVLTAAPDLANLRNAKNLIDKIKSTRSNDAPPLLVLNQVGLPKRPEISVREFAGALECEPKAVIDFDAQLFGTAANNGQMIEEVSNKAKAAEQFRDLAYLLSERTEPKAQRTSLLAPILSRLNLRKAGA
ncbi:MAG: AAA family ATPase [Hyphomicrobiales bacterium]|nr:AAA family ATPase [Hyphomicrobiales bacterium]